MSLSYQQASFISEGDETVSQLDKIDHMIELMTETDQKAPSVDSSMSSGDSGFSTPTSGYIVPPSLSPPHQQQSHSTTAVNSNPLVTPLQSQVDFQSFFLPNAVMPISPSRSLSSYPLRAFNSRCANNKIELKIISQPEEQHRARYLTEGSRGVVRDRTGKGYPIVKLCGYNHQPLTLQCYIGDDKNYGKPHLFYDLIETGKPSAKKSSVNGTSVLEFELHPANNMEAVIDCVGILKRRKSDIENNIRRSRKQKRLSGAELDKSYVDLRNAKRQTRCCLVFRCLIPETQEVLQVATWPILCTQPPGTPEISKVSHKTFNVNGGQELIILGNHFTRDAKIIWENDTWKKVTEPNREFFNIRHLVCEVPRYGGYINGYGATEVRLSVRCGMKQSDYITLYYHNFPITPTPFNYEIHDMESKIRRC